jgi:hypothetical protein
VEHVTSTRVDVPSMTGGMSVLAPFTLRIAVAAPAHVDSALLEGSADARWQDATLSVGIGTNGPRDYTLDTTKVDAEVTGSHLLLRKVAAEVGQVALSPSDSGGTNVEVAFADLRLSIAEFDLPAVTGVAASEISVPLRALLLGRVDVLAPATARNIDVALQSGGARLTASGEMAVDAEGVLDGKMTVVIAGAEALPEFIAALPDQWEKIANVVVGGMFVFGRPTTLGGQPATELLLEVDHGNARVGPVEFELPRVPL